MTKQKIAFAVLVLLSIGLAANKVLGQYAELAGSAKYLRALGFALGPWMIGAVVAGLKAGVQRLRGRPTGFLSTLLWATGVVIVILGASAVLSSKAADRQTVRDDAMLLLGAAAWVPSVAAYCDKYVAKNPEIIEAAISWNKRHRPQLDRIILAVDRSGGLTKEEKQIINRVAFAALRNEVEGQGDKIAYCQDISSAIAGGTLDLDRRDDTAAALRRVTGDETR